MQLNELFAPPPDETSGQIILRTPMSATAVGTGTGQKQLQLPKGTVITLTKKLPQKKMVQFTVDGKPFYTTDESWKQSVRI